MVDECYPKYLKLVSAMYGNIYAKEMCSLTSVCVHACMCESLCVHACMCKSLCVHACMHACVFMCMCVYMQNL